MWPPSSSSHSAKPVCTEPTWCPIRSARRCPALWASYRGAAAGTISAAFRTWWIT